MAEYTTRYEVKQSTLNVSKVNGCAKNAHAKF